MARIAQIGLALALLVVGGAAVQLAPGAEGVCGRGYKEFEHLDGKHPHACLVYCVPKGSCEKKQAVSTRLHFTGPGDCHELGFTEPAPLGNLTGPIMEKLEKLKGPCKGMQVLKFRKPAEHKEPASPPAGPPAKGLCTRGTPFKAIKDFRGVCTTYCVPDGSCLGMAQAGKLGHLGVIGEGLCASDGYTHRVEPTEEERAWVSHLYGSCKGMTMHQFRFSPAQSMEPAAGRSCGPELHPFRAVARHRSGKTTCSAYCVPEGPCRGMAEKGNLASLGISGEGGCGERDFPEPVAVDNMTLFVVKSIGGKPCRGMTVRRFQKPAPEPENPTGGKVLDPAAGRSCGPNHHAFRAVKTLFGGRKVCSAFCVPDGPCHGEMQRGHLSPRFGIAEEGRCAQKEFPEPVPLKTSTLLRAKSTGGGPCKKMTMHSFQTAAPPGEVRPALDPLAGRTCGRDQHPFRGVAALRGGGEVCSAYCVPEGPCLGMAQRGRLKSLGIAAEGGCAVGDYPEPVRLGSMTLSMVKRAGGGACKGMTVHRFRRQAPAGAADGGAGQ